MSADTLLVILLVWAVAGLLAAIAFGKAVSQNDDPRNENEPLPHAAGAIKYFRNNKRKSDTRRTNTEHAHGSALKTHDRIIFIPSWPAAERRVVHSC